MLIQQILWGLGLIIVGGLTLMFNYQLVGFVRLDWVEGKIGPGTTYLVYKVASVLVILAGVITIAGFGDNLLNWLTSPLHSLFNTK